jgi:hypothetical protein
MLFLINDNGVPSVAEWVRATLPGDILPGDFNEDGSVDTADYAVWRKGLGTTHTPADYIDWQRHFGQSAGAGSGTTVPEPTGLVPCVVAITLCTGHWYRSRTSARDSLGTTASAISALPT